MRYATLDRMTDNSPDEGTAGILTTDTGVKFCTLELPWRDNVHDLSRILAGVYNCELLDSVRFGAMLYHVLNVPGRDSVEIHWGNWAGDITLHWKSNVDGCILLGLISGQLRNDNGMMQKAVIHSIVAIKEFIKEMGGEPFQLTINDPS